MTREKIDHYFDLLEHALATVKLPTSTGESRFVRVGEFMCMREHQGNIHFKHIGQRNYLYMDKSTGQLTIPVGAAFHLGHFDQL